MSLHADVSDVALIHRVVAGDEEAADLFVTRFTRLVWWVLTHRLRLDPEPAGELYQDVFVHLWGEDYRRLRNWSGEGDFAAYLAPIVRHRGLDRIRKGNARREQPLPGNEEDSGSEPVDDRPGPEELARLEEQRRQLEQAVAALGEQDRKLYELRFGEEQSYREIALACGITVNHTGVRLSRLVERLRASIVEPGAPKPRKTGDAVRSPGAGPSIK